MGADEILKNEILIADLKKRFEKGKILLFSSESKNTQPDYKLANIIDIDWEFEGKSIDLESIKGGNVVIGLITIYSKSLEFYKDCTRELILERSKNGTIFFWCKYPSPAMQDYFKQVVYGCVSLEDLDIYFLQQEVLKLL